MFRRLSPLVLFAMLAACGGGGGSTGSTLPQTPVGPTQGTQNVTVSFTIPAAAVGTASSTRRPLYVSAATNSALVAVDGGKPVVANLSPASSNCTPASGGGRTCQIAVSAPVGSVTFAVSLFASTDGSGAVLSQNTIAQTIVSGTANVVNIALDGVVASITLTLGNASPPSGTTSTTTLSVNFLDASHNTILGNDPFANPVTLTDSDTSGATKLSKTSITSPADAAALTVTYNGATLGSAVFSAAASGVAPGNVKPATLTPQTPVSTALVDWPTYAYDSQRSGYNPFTTGITPASIAKIHVAWQTAINGSTQTQPIVVTNVGGHKALLIVANFAIAQAYDAMTGAKVWEHTLPIQDVQDCGAGGISGSAQYDKSQNAIFMAAGSGGGAPNHVVLYRLDAGTGAQTGQVDVTPTLQAGEANYAHSGITLANGRIYLGTGSDCEGTATGRYPSWRGRVVSVDPVAMTLTGTFFPTWGQGGNYGGGGIWSWGGVSVDPSGNVYAATGNAETSSAVDPQSVAAPFIVAPSEQTGYAEHLVKLSSDLSAVGASNYPGFNFAVGNSDLDYAGTPVIYQPTLTAGCGVLSATQSKGGTLTVNRTQDLSVVNTFTLSVPSGEALYMGNPAYSPATGYLYAPITSTGAGGALLQPGLAAIGGCGSSISWTTQFGPDSALYSGENPRSAPTVTAGGVVFIGTPCTSDQNGGCGSPGAVQGALWAIDGTVPKTVLGGGKPVLITGDNIRMAPSADGLWVFVLDGSGNLYGLTVDPSVKAVAARPGRRVQSRTKVRN